jgi:hypothetical protein
MSFLDLLDLRLVTAPRIVFGTTCSVGNGPLRQRFQSCIELLALGMLLWLIIFSSLMALLGIVLILLERHMIES